MEHRGYPHAVVGPAAGVDIARLEAPADVAGVDYYWRVRWLVTEPYEQAVVPQPRVHLAAEDGRLLVHGVIPRTFTRHLDGRGHVLGASFLPAGFHGYLRRDVADLHGVVAPAAEVLGVDDRPAAERILRPDATDEEMVDALSGYLRAVPYRAQARADEITALVDHAERDRGLTRAADLASYAGVSLRTLQREFATYVGVGPKWVVQRFRLLDAAAAARAGGPADWAALAAELGFSDQAHLVRRFTEVVGTPPATYARALGEDRPQGPGADRDGSRRP